MNIEEQYNQTAPHICYILIGDYLEFNKKTVI